MYLTSELICNEYQNKDFEQLVKRPLSSIN